MKPRYWLPATGGPAHKRITGRFAFKVWGKYCFWPKRNNGFATIEKNAAGRSVDPYYVRPNDPYMLPRDLQEVHEYVINHPGCSTYDVTLECNFGDEDTTRVILNRLEKAGVLRKEKYGRISWYPAERNLEQTRAICATG